MPKPTKTMQSLVSIIIPTFNSARFISETVQSVKNQTHQNWEMIVVDDCSEDNTFEIIKNFAKTDSRIKFFQLQKNSGTGVARDFALSKCNGNYIAFLDADDLWKPKKLEIQLDFMQKNNLNFTFCFYECINEAGINIKKTIQAPNNLSYRQLFFCNFIGNLTAIYNVDFFGKIPISPIRKRQDWMLWLTILKQIKSAKPVPESLAYYRIRQNSVSASKKSLLKHNFNVYRQFHGLSLILSGFCMIGFLFTLFFVKPFFIKKK